MKKYTFSFNGRVQGAIGITYKIQDTYTAKSISEAKSLLYTDYDLISIVNVITGGTLEEFNKAEFIIVRPNSERKRLSNGNYMFTRSDTTIS